jgi:ribosomal protein L11 methyltransferase
LRSLSDHYNEFSRLKAKVVFINLILKGKKMFSAYSWFEKPELYAAVRAASLAWAGSGEKWAALRADAAETLAPVSRTLDPAELVGLKEQMDSAWEGHAFGGVICGTDLGDLRGWYHFTLNPEKTDARLTGLALDPALAAFPPLQNPALHLALLALLKELPALKAVFLPFGEPSEEDFKDLWMLRLRQVEDSGGWLTGQKVSVKTDLLAYMSDMVTPAWYELRLTVAPALAPLALRLFNRYGHKNKTWLEPTFKTGLLGEEIQDLTAPYTVITSLPNNANNLPRLESLQEALRNLAKVSPLPALSIREISRAGAVTREERIGGYRIGRHFIINVLAEDSATAAPGVAPEDLLINLKADSHRFGPQRGFIHPTSQVTLELMEGWLDPAQYKKVLDLGTGTGALAIAAARLGTNYVLAIDPDRVAVNIARENVVLNGLEEKIVTEAGSLGLEDMNQTGYTFSEELQRRPPSLDEALPFDAILANLFGPNLVTLAGAISEALRPGGLLICSGIEAKHLGEVTAAFEAAGLKIEARHELFSWFGLACRKA